MPARAQDQLALDEQPISNADLEQALENRLRAGDDVSEARSVYKRVDEVVKAHIAELELTTGVAYRCGRFRITKNRIPARSVTFDTEATERVRISLIEDE